MLISNSIILAAAAPPFLAEVVALFVAGAGIAYVCHRLGLVPIIGFLLAGVVIGPKALGLVQDPALVDAAAEIGVILLLFTIGIEFSLGKLASIGRLIFGGGGLQVLLATGAMAGALAVLGVGWQAGVFTGFLVALSSTAIVLKLLGDRGETNTPAGQVGLGLLIFQDLAVIVMVLLVPMLAGGGGSSLDLLGALGKAALLIAGVLVIARRFMPKLLEQVALTCSPELFLLVVIAICFGTAYLTSLAGVSVSLGAFLAGLIVSESRFSQHAFSEILPLQILFSATFFISVGMLLDVGFLVSNLPLVLGVVALVTVLKVLTTGVSVLALGYPLHVAGASALLLAQVGEFSFVLERTGRELGLFPAGNPVGGSQTFIAATVLLMILTPLLAALASRLQEGMERKQAAHAAAYAGVADTPPEAAATHSELYSDHVIVAGYGEAARKLVRVLGRAEIPFVITTLSPGGANEAEDAGLPVIRGDVSKQHILSMAGLLRARAVVIPDDDAAMAHRIASVVRTTNPAVRIVVRTRFASDVDDLTHAGADRVASEELESVAALAEDVLEHYAVSEAAARPLLEAVRTEREVAAAPVLVPSRSAGDGAALADPSNAAGPAMLARIDTETKVAFQPHGDPSRCSHLGQIRPVFPSARGCEECLQTGDTWVHLRLCMTCGHVGCCDSSKNKHATKHNHATHHPIVRSFEPGESWGWCYEDRVML